MGTAMRNRNIEVEDLPRYTISDWEQWEGKWELIDGIPFALSPMPGKKHQRINGRLYMEFTGQLGNCPDCEAYLPVNYKVNDSNLLHPDLLVVCGEEEEGTYISTTPHLVVEIISSSTKTKDKKTKLKIYQALGIRYYLIIDPRAETISVFELAEGGGYELKAEGRNISYEFEFGGCKIAVDFSRIWKGKE
ncbi:MAG: Uma2 family endonuclease [Lewinellaceae bacterium]|nr:Uma2 family endonuclease [Phaeodactylibacter sp.]MCB9035845.1 Uma2 family endonuclease [Lewinellaceae bacterium]